jgi:hypothetical protein
MSIPGSGLEPKMMAHGEMINKMAAEANQKKCGTDNNVKAVESCGYKESPSVN